MALRSTDLMIGDWVKFPIGYEKIQEISYQQEIGGYCVWFAASATLFPCMIEDIEPIPLIPEILEKNGFERCVSSIAKTSTAVIPICDSNQFCHKNLGNLRIIDKHPCHGWTLRTDVFGDTSHNEIHHINYVHELQHALKLCGITLNIEL